MASLDQHQPLRQLDAQLDVHPAIISALIRRVRSLVTRLIDRDIDEERITGAEGLIDKRVISAFHELGGDFGDAVPYALLEARKTFERDAEKQPLDHGLNQKRMVACEVLVVRLVAHIERSSIEKGPPSSTASHHLCLTKKFRRYQSDGDVEHPTSALEAAIDQNCVPVLASIEARRATQAIWNGSLVQRYSPNGYTYFVPYDKEHDGAFLSHFHPSRLGVPKYSYITNIVLWVFFLAIFTVQTRTLKSFDLFEGILWVMAAGYFVEDASRWVKMGGLGAIEFWTVMDILTDGLLLVSFSFRVASFVTHGKHADTYELRAFQFLACVAPLIWVQLLKVADGFVYFGTLTVIILRMFKESAIFFTLLALVMVGFGHAFLALDAADESRVDNVVVRIIDVLTQALLGGADFDLTNEDAFGYPYGHILYYAYCFVTAVILLNILIAFFGTAYSDVVDSADEVYAAFFCQKVIAMVRAPDQFVYLPPFNLLEAFVIAPLEWIVSHETYAKLNYSVQSVLFALPLMCIAFYESRAARNGGSIRLPLLEEEETDASRSMLQGTNEDPIVPEMEGSGGLQISRTKFEDLVGMMQR